MDLIVNNDYNDKLFHVCHTITLVVRNSLLCYVTCSVEAHITHNKKDR